jgi:hypothetical protein
MANIQFPYSVASSMPNSFGHAILAALIPTFQASALFVRPRYGVEPTWLHPLLDRQPGERFDEK